MKITRIFNCPQCDNRSPGVLYCPRCKGSGKETITFYAADPAWIKMVAFLIVAAVLAVGAIAFGFSGLVWVPVR